MSNSGSHVPPSSGAPGLGETDPASVARGLFGWTERLVGIDAAAIYVAENGDLRIRWAYELDLLTDHPARRIPLDADDPIAQTFHTGRARVVAGEDAIGAMASLGWQTAVCIPMTAAGRPMGVYVAGWSLPYQISPETVLVVEGAASMAAAALYRSRLVSELHREEQRLRTLLEGLPLPAWVVSQETLEVTWLNEAARQLFGDSRGLTISEMAQAGQIRGFPEDLTSEELNRLLARPTVTRVRVTDAKGSERVLDTRTADLGGEEFVVTGVDVTNEVSLEAHRARFIAMISHLLRTPLTPLRGYAELLRGVVGAEEVGAVEAILLTVDNLSEQVARLELAASLQPMDTSQLTVSSVGRILASAAARAGRSLDDLSLAGETGETMLCHPTYTAVAIAEVIDNAFTHGNPPVEVSVEPALHAVSIRITDQGPGIPAQWEKAVFSPFVTAERGHVVSGRSGVGLGLTLARGLTEATHGHLEYEAGEFVFTLPRPPDTSPIRP